ncbi:MAG: hypothetical protein JWQ53_1016 [Klenkia sp.]|nr:hypothetical protein [Klenkia sp.]
MLPPDTVLAVARGMAHDADGGLREWFHSRNR